jgi:tripartite-type tricarboxylate transporter receptor subunit TctC
MTCSKLFACLATVLFGLNVSTSAVAQEYPTKPVRIVVPFVPGGVGDIVSRIIAEHLFAVWKQPVLVDNKPGANGHLGAALVAQAAPDGYTLLVTDVSTVTTNAELYAKLPYATSDLAPVINLVRFPLILVAPAQSQIGSLRQLLDMDKTQAAALNVASSGVGAGPHLALEKFKSMSGLPLQHLPFKGAGQAFTNLVGGHVDLMFTSGPLAGPYLKDGRIKAFAVTADKRARFAPQVPTFAEAGFKNFEWYAAVSMLTRAGTPPDLVRKINADVAAVLRKPEVQSKLADMGLDLVDNTPEQFAAWIEKETTEMRTLIRAANVKVD